MINGVTYNASRTMSEFHNSDKFVRALIGPIGSGKSVACVIELMIKAMAQKPDADGQRKTRFVIVRNTYRELLDTTIKTFQDWVPEELGLFKKMDLTFVLDIDLPDGTHVHSEFMYRALDKPNDIKKLLSLEVTGAWMNEVREIPKQIMDMLIGRLGRYPRTKDGYGATWHGLIIDTNPPDSDHWFYKLFEESLPDSYAIFHQPSGTSPEAENIDNLPDGYYRNMKAGKDAEWLSVYVHGNYGFIMDGKPVFPEYHDDVHSTPEPLTLSLSLPIYIGIDFGLTPAATFGQKTAAGRWLIFDELVATDMGAKNFGRILNEKINKDYHNYKLEIYADPAGDQRAQTDEVTPFQILAVEGINAWPTYTNDPIIRIEAVAATLGRLDFAGNSGFVIGPKAPMIRKALAGGYKYRRMAVSGEERFQDKPDKGRYSHVADSLQYMMVGAGEGGKLVSNDSWASALDYSHIDKLVV